MQFADGFFQRAAVIGFFVAFTVTLETAPLIEMKQGAGEFRAGQGLVQALFFSSDRGQGWSARRRSCSSSGKKPSRIKRLEHTRFAFE